MLSTHLLAHYLMIPCFSVTVQANNFLWPFKLSSPKGGYKKKLNHFIEVRRRRWSNLYRYI